MFYKIIVILITPLMLLSSCSKKNNDLDVRMEDAIEIATNIAKKNNYNMHDCAIEAIIYKNKVEKGPIRIDWLVHTFPRDVLPELIKKDFWLIYIYPTDTSIIGGDFTVLVDLHTGGVIATKAGK